MIEVVGAEVPIESSVFQHVVDGSEKGSSDGADGLLWSAASAQTMELSFEVAFLLAARRPGTLHERGVKPRCTFAQAGRSALAGTLVVAGNEARPGQEMAGGREVMSVPISDTIT